MRRFFLGFLLFFGMLRAGSEEELTKSLNQSGMFLYYLINKSHNTIFLSSRLQRIPSHGLYGGLKDKQLMKLQVLST